VFQGKQEKAIENISSKVFFELFWKIISESLEDTIRARSSFNSIMFLPWLKFDTFHDFWGIKYIFKDVKFQRNMIWL
jgi:hypothetical protein